jgi:two-component system sensor histidine kinase YesM
VIIYNNRKGKKMRKNYLIRLKEAIIKKLYNYTIYNRLMRSFIIAFVIPILLIGGFNGLYSFRKSEREAQVFLEESSKQISNNISYYLYYHMNLLDEIATNPQIISNLSIYESSDWNVKSDIENHIRLVIGHTFGASNAINACEIVTQKKSYFYYLSPVSNGNFKTSSILSQDARDVKMTVSRKEVPSDRNYYVILTREIFQNNEKSIGNIVTALDLSYFNKACYENVTNLLNEVLIIDENNIIVSASNEELVRTEFREESFRVMSISTRIPNTKLTIVNQMPMATLLKSAIIQTGFTLVAALLFAFLSLFLVLLFTRSISSPIKTLIKEMNKPDVHKYIQDDGADEYHLIIDGFNQMNEHIVHAIEGQYEMQLQESELKELQKEAELSALQQQINPHFLYNTLESIYWNCQLEGEEEIGDIVNALSNYLRVIIDKGREDVTIEMEVESVNNYIFLQNKRFGNRVSVTWNVSKQMRSLKIIKLAIHPIVEDVLVANLNDIEEQIDATITITQDKQDIHVIMEGNAVTYFLGVKDDSLENMNGINSVDERLKLYFGEAYGVVLDEEISKINVCIPMSKQNEGESYDR